MSKTKIDSRTVQEAIVEAASDGQAILSGLVTEFCDFRCMYARGDDCECHICGGWNHGVLRGF